MLAHLYYYAKAYVAALSTGVLYLATVIGPDLTFADLGHVSLLHWIGFAASVLGIGGLTAVVTNGDKPAKNTPTSNAAPAVTHVFNVAPASDSNIPAPADGGFQSKVEAAISGPVTPAAPAVIEPDYSTPAPVAPVAPVEVPATPAQ